MTRVKVGDKIILKKRICILGEEYIGKKFTIVDINDKHIYFKADLGVGAMGYDELDEFFYIVESKDKEESKVETEKSKSTLKSKIKLILRGMK